MRILSIETSCDDTGISILEVKGRVRNPTFVVLANNVSSQTKLHTPYGGVFPALAKREHIKNLPIVLEKTFRDAGIMRGESGQNPGIDLIAVTYGPGLEPALWTGIVFAKELAEKWNIPIMPVNHMEGHIISVFAKGKGKFKLPKLKTPALALLVSGGHTELVLVNGWMDYKIIGETLDDAVGEAFDKVARMLGLPYPGGPEISKLAEIQRNMLLKRTDIFLLKNSSCSRRRAPKSFQEHASFPLSTEISLPRPMLHSKNFDFSFSGLKTAVLYLIKKIGPLDEKTKSKIALEFENAAIEPLVYKTMQALEKYKIKTLIVGGGVSANRHLQNEIKKSIKLIKKNKIELLFPAKELTGDNSLMIGLVGYLQYVKNKGKANKASTLRATGNLRL